MSRACDCIERVNELKEGASPCYLCAGGFEPFKAEGLMWHQVNGRGVFRCESSDDTIGKDRE